MEDRRGNIPLAPLPPVSFPAGESAAAAASHSGHCPGLPRRSMNPRLAATSYSCGARPRLCTGPAAATGAPLVVGRACDGRVDHWRSVRRAQHRRWCARVNQYVWWMRNRASGGWVSVRRPDAALVFIARARLVAVQAGRNRRGDLPGIAVGRDRGMDHRVGLHDAEVSPLGTPFIPPANLRIQRCRRGKTMSAATAEAGNKGPTILAATHGPPNSRQTASVNEPSANDSW